MTTNPEGPTDQRATQADVSDGPGAEPTTAFERPAAAVTPPPWELDTPDEAPPRRLSVGYLVTGLVFLGIAGLWLAHEIGTIQVDDLDVLVPLLLVVVGAAGLVTSLVKAARRHE